MLGWSPLKQFAEGNGENRNLNGSKNVHAGYNSTHP